MEDSLAIQETLNPANQHMLVLVQSVTAKNAQAKLQGDATSVKQISILARKMSMIYAMTVVNGG